MIKLMKKLIALTSALVAYPLAVIPVFADQNINACPNGAQFGNLCNQNAATLGPTVGKLISAAFVIAIIIALGYLIYGGVKWILSEGDKTKVEESRNHVIAAVIGLIVVFLSYFLLNLVIGLFLGQGASLSNLQFPSL